MPCDDRQLTDAQRAAAFDQQRTGVQRAIRPFSGEATPENLVDYLNRELVPIVKQARDKVNEVFLQVKDNAPSANPLGYYFSTNTANADPTAGRVRLDNATQDSATTIRVSQSNGRLADVTSWLDVMAGSATEPLGVVTLTDAINPGRFIRFDLDTMTDQGAYWDLAVTPVESSHDNPFVDEGAVVISFIPGVASGGSTGGGATVPAGSMGDFAVATVLANPYDDSNDAESPPEEWPIANLAGDGLEGESSLNAASSPFPDPVDVYSFTSATAATSHVITMPADREPRDRIIVIIKIEVNSATTQDIDTPSGWTSLAEQTTLIGGGAAVFERILADGETITDTLTVTCSVSGAALGFVFLVRGGHLTNAASIVSEFSNSSVTTATVAPLFPPYGEANSLFISALCLTTDTASGDQVTAFPDYADETGQVELDSAGGSTDGNVAIAYAQTRVVGVEPSAWTWQSSSQYIAFTLAVPPRETMQLQLSAASEVPGETIVANVFDEPEEARATPLDDLLGASLEHSVTVGNGPFPDSAFRQTFLFSTQSTSHSVPLPGLSEGQAVLAFVACGTAVTPGVPAVHDGWVSLATLSMSSSTARVLWLPPRTAEEAENTDPEAFTFASAQTCIVRIWIIDDHNRDTNPSIVTAVNASTAGATSADIGSLTPTPGDGSAEANYTYIAMIALQGEENVISAFPTNYTETGQDSISGASNLDALIGYGERQVRGSSENPDAFTYAASSNGRSGAALVALIPRPAARIERAALTGAIAASQNSNATTFAGILDNGAAENNRTNLNFVNGTNTTATVTDDSGNDELEIRVNVDDFPLTGLADQAAETFLGNFTASPAPPTARAGSSVAGAGLTYTAGGTLAVGAGDGIDVAADSVAVDVTDIIDNVTITEVATNNIQRAALTGFAAASAGSNATTSAEPIVTYSASANMSAERVTTSSTSVAVSTSVAGQIEFQRAALTGDVTASANSNATTIANDAVTNAKAANMAANTLKANPTASSADPQDLAISANSLAARVGGNLVSHPFSTLAGAGLSYSAGVIDAFADASKHGLIDADGIGFRKSRRRHFWYEDFDVFPSDAAIDIDVEGQAIEFGQTQWLLEGIGGPAITADIDAVSVSSTGANHPGVVRITTDATSGEGARMYRGGHLLDSSFGTIRGDRIYSFETVVRVPTTTANVFFAIGMADDLAGSGINNAIEFYASAGGSVHAYCEAGTVATDTDTGFTPVADEWNVYGFIQESAGTIDFYIDDALEATISTNVPDAETGVIGIGIVTQTAGARSIDIDYIAFESRDLGARTS